MTRYRPLVKLGSGGMADVYLAVSRTTAGLEKLAVIKRLRPDIGDDPDEVAHFKGMFWDEAKLAMLLNHSNVVHTHDAYEEGGALYLVMEYIEGQSLNKVQRELARAGKSLTPKQSALIMSEVLAGLHYAHELTSLSGEKLNIVHRDVSPQNILLGYNGSIKLVDFGVAMASTRSTETRAGTLKGKARYMAPEQVLNTGKLDRRADIYAIGVVLWELIAGRKLVAGANMVEQLVNVLKTEPERLSSIIPDVDPELDAIVHKALAREPDDRYETAQQMREALLKFANRDGDVNTDELGALVSTVFAKKREEIAAIIRERLAATPAEETTEDGLRMSTPDLPVMDETSERSLPSGTGVSAPRSAPSSSFTPHGVVQPAEEMAPAAAHASKKTINLLVGALLVLLLAFGALAGFVVSNRSEKVAASTATPVAETKLPEPKVAEPTPPEAPVPTATQPKTSPDHAAAEAPKAAPAAPKVAAPAAPPVQRWTPPPAPAPAPQPTPAAPAPAQETEQGFLTIDTYPWTRVSLNGRVLGNTPLVRVALPAGTHVLTLENPQDNVKQTTTVVIKPNETVSKRLAF